MTRRLIEERGFCAVAVEADWPDAYRVNRYVRGRGDDVDAEEALRGFQRFPTWLWRNAAVLDFVGWLRERNDRLGDELGKAAATGSTSTASTAPSTMVTTYPRPTWIRRLPSGPGTATPASTTTVPTTARPTAWPPRWAPGTPASRR
jgi:erythromycin esterase-like protein